MENDDLLSDINVDPHKEIGQDDLQVIELLHLVDQYQEIQNNLNRHLQEGFIQLSRASYSSGKKYGYTQIDLREKEPLRTVTLQDGSATLDTKLNSGEKEKSSRNPLEMFGALPPFSLKQSQVGFAHSLANMVDLINKRNTLLKVYKQVKRGKKEIPTPHVGQTDSTANMPGSSE